MLVGIIILITHSCKKFVEIDPPVDSITTIEAFDDENTATSSIIGIYSRMINTGHDFGFSSSAMPIFTGLYTDELNTVIQTSVFNQFSNCALLPDNGTLLSNFWSPLYSSIYHANSAIESLKISKNVSKPVINQLTGEAKFIRAFCYFYLVNLFGDVPLVTTTDWKTTSLLFRVSKSEIYQQIIDDLQVARDLLADDFSISSGERVRPNKWAATALLARIYLYTNDWNNAKTMSNEVIESSNLFDLVENLNNVFLTNSKEAIWQLKQNNTVYPYAATVEGSKFIAPTSTSIPTFYLSQQLINGFEINDKRKIHWLGTTAVQGTTYYYPFKYKSNATNPGSTIMEYYMILRLAEQYLIRSEAKAKQNDLAGAINDLNAIRLRAGLAILPLTLNQDQVLNAIAQENRIELFAEWGHRWLYLKRANQANSVLGSIKGANWQPFDELFPIPLSEIQRDPNLSQNLGY